MARFCKYCGTQLEEGQVCSCPEAQAAAPVQQPVQPQAAPQPEAPPQPQAAPQQQAAPAAPSPAASAFKNLLPFCKAYFRSPVNATRAALAQNDLILAILLLAIQAIAVGLVVFSLLNRICNLAEAALVAIMQQMGVLGSSSDPFGSLFAQLPTISASFFMCLIYGIVAAVIAIAVFAVLIFAVGKIAGSACSFKDAIIACGANSLFVTILFLLTFLVFFVSIPVGLFLFMITMLAWIVMGVLAAQAITTKAEQGKFWISCIAAVLVALLVGGWASGKFFGMAAGATKITYNNESIAIGEALEEITDGIDELDFEDLAEDLMRGLYYEFF